MAFTKLLLPILLFALCLVGESVAQTCTSSSQITTCTLPVTLYDHAPAHMAHWRYPAQWWKVNAFNDFPNNGSCGTANNTMGWSNSDFELPLYVLQNIPCCSVTAPIVNGEKGLAGRLCTAADGSDTGCGTLSSDGRPIYAYGNNRSPLGQVSNADSFYTFFRPVQQTMPVPFNLTLTQSQTDNRLRSFVDLAFFPLDGLGWNDWNSAFDVNGLFEKHNYGFCMVMNTHFTYSGGEYFNFLGDDDVYAYINGYLIMDLGGVHTALNASINTDSLKLNKDTPYRFDFFYCERHTTSSEIKFETTINFFCAYTDWCGKCDGDGQSCCSNLCDDLNPCTIDKCDVYNAPPLGCHHTNVTCPPSTPCTNSYCNTTTGACTTSPVVCEDFDECTDNKCGAGGCYFPTRDCSSSDMCLITGCNSATGCTSQPRACSNNNNLCVNSSCSSTVGCLTTNIPCQTFNACQTASCTPSQGCSIVSNPPCNDQNVCTADFCDAKKGCLSTPKNLTTMCGVSDLCTQYSCDPIKGCLFTNTKCVAPDACTSAICVPSLGCQYVSNTSCPSDACRTGVCDAVNGGCKYTPKAPCPSRSCYNSTCNSSLGCVYSPVTCTTTKNCTTSSCVNNQCVNTVIQGTAGCDLCNGVSCDTSDLCNPQVCVNNTCQVQPKSCEDYNLCTKDTCYVSNGQAKCNNTLLACGAGDACHPQSCNSATGTCVFNNITCNDNNPCTNDYCVVLPGFNNFTCKFELIECFSDDPFCNPVQCQGGVCVNSSLPDCSDGSSCTFDVCSNGSCSNPPVCPNSGTLCDPIVCVDGTCITEPVNCTSGNLCSMDSCDPATGYCVHTPKNCNGTVCAPSSCDPATGTCAIPPLLSCDDNNPCTLDQLTCSEDYGFVCNNSDQSNACNSHSACILDYCNASAPVSQASDACYHTNVSCAAPSMCMVVAGCDARNGCVYAPKICPTPADWCQVSVCDDIAGCIIVARACAPADNYCFQGTCDNTTKSCSQQARPNWGIITNQNSITCLTLYEKGTVVGLTAGIIAAIVIAAVVAAALIAIAGKKGVDVFLASRAAPLGPAEDNPLYVKSATTGNNPLHR